MVMEHSLYPIGWQKRRGLYEGAEVKVRLRTLVQLMPWTPELRKAWYEKNRHLCTNVDPETYEEVKAYAKKNKMSLGETLRCFIEWGLSESSETLQQPPVRSGVHHRGGMDGI